MINHGQSVETSVEPAHPAEVNRSLARPAKIQAKRLRRMRVSHLKRSPAKKETSRAKMKQPARVRPWIQRTKASRVRVNLAIRRSKHSAMVGRRRSAAREVIQANVVSRIRRTPWGREARGVATSIVIRLPR